MDQLTMIGPICKGAWMPRTAEEIPSFVARAFRVATSGIPGPVHLTLPYDVLHQPVYDDAVAIPEPADFKRLAQTAPEHQISRIVELLEESVRPIILVGPSATRGQSGRLLAELSDLTGVPHLPIDSAVGLGEPSLHGLQRMLPRCDLVILLARQDFAVNFTDERTIAPGVPLVQVAPDPASIGQNRLVDLGIVADPTSVLAQLHDAARAQTWLRRKWRDELDAMRRRQVERTEPFETSDEVPIHPLRVMGAVSEFLRPGDCIALDGGDFVRWARWRFGGGPYEFLTNGKLGALGPGIPLAAAAALAKPRARTIAFVGDGTFGFHAMELDTAVRHNLPYVVIVGNDAGWATERHRQREVYGEDRLVAADLLPTRYDLLAESLGAHGEFVERPEQLTPALERAFASGKPACINVNLASIRAPSAS
jgi:acetolactate synthase-1/2/3 large subunit